ncbi:MAG: hypothetical protein IT184_13450 [Acidobacteria bacterium]|nr:hypothetical protein [Acidobacteriota bacterium]
MSANASLHRGQSVPHIRVQTVTGRTFTYSDVWQHRNLVLVVLPAAFGRAEDEASSLAELDRRRADFVQLQAEVVVTREPVPGLPAPAVLVADRWGEILYVDHPTDTRRWPATQELLDWLDWAERRCPECEGETK